MVLFYTNKYQHIFIRMILSIKQIILSCVRKILPLECPVCGGKPNDGAANTLCRDCLAQIEYISPPYCPGCGGTLDGIFEMCSDCMKEEARRPWSNAFTIFRMRGAGRELVHAFKYQSRPDLARALAALAMMRCGEAIRKEQFDLIVPVPLHWWRKMRRSYNQAEEFAKAFGAVAGIPVKSVLKRKKWTGQQSKLSRKHRISNLKGAFSINRSTNPEKRAILLVDDVMTTGSTLAAAAETLLKAGAGKVCILTLARRQ